MTVSDQERPGKILSRQRRRHYRMVRHPVSGLSVMVPVGRSARKVTAVKIARLTADLS